MSETTEASEWGDITTLEPETIVKAATVPEEILLLAKKIIEADSLDIPCKDWPEDKIKRFQKYMTAAAEKLGVKMRKQVITRKDETPAIRCTVMRTAAEKVAPTSGAATEETSSEAPGQEDKPETTAPVKKAAAKK